MPLCGLGLGPLPTSAFPAVSSARPLRSLGWRVPCEMTVLNDLDRPLKLYWLNYDGDPESFGLLGPGSSFTVHTFESHAWRFVDSASGATLAEHVAGAGQQVVRLATKAAAAAGAGGAAAAGEGGVSYTYTTAAPDSAAAQQHLQQPSPGGGGGRDVTEGVAAGPPEAAAGEAQSLSEASEWSPEPSAAVADASREGFDGLGNDEAQYTLAQLREISIYPGGGTVLLSLPASPLAAPLEVSLAGPEALSLVAATGSLEQRRPSTLGTWSRSLLAAGVELRRVCITRVVDGIYYCRLVLSRPDSSLTSLDATPGDSLSLAMELGRPIYVSNEVARVHQSVFDIFNRRREAMQAAAEAGTLDEAAEAAADREAQEALDAVTRGLPSAPRPVRALEVDRALEA
ncbi:hypothetical protein GPECTOR_1g506 [Gonium pectorale]|uniref:BFN domain-containing protein n=1 Tax=Gonium pectorale TaxID=33097 RepID=A0A150H3D7_GONPE|nr:hypothetical protein GPECTOR_1g506 [Gonium pectorale]|eukprot:KXZ56564.1 hypothetical protein GPECTOR_1g506 [Gonium pectorale]